MRTPRAWPRAGAQRVVVTGNLKFDAPSAAGTAASRARPARAVRPGPARVRRRVDARRRGGAAASPRWRPAALPARDADGDRAAASAAVRRSGGAARGARRRVRAAQRPPRRCRPRCRRGARRFDGRVVGLLCGGGCRVHRWQPAVAGRPEPDRGDRRRYADARGSAHVQLRGGDAQCDRRRCGAARRGCGRTAGGSRDAARRIRARREAMRDAALAFHAAHRGAADRLWAWLAPQLAVSRSGGD